ncbi:MAG: hypothetical protein AAB696_01350 [Patescibacteria group bacterium]
MKIILWALIIIVLSGLAYFGLREERTFSFIFGNDSFKSFSSASKTDQPMAGKISIENLGVKVKENLSEAMNKSKFFVVKIIKETEEKIKEKTKEKTFEIVQEGLKSAEDAAGNILGVDLGKINSEQVINQNSSNDFFSYLIKINTPLSFIIKNPFSSADAKNINYQIDWGDGEKDIGELKAEKNTTVVHSWNKEKEYLIKFKITTVESGEFDYQIKILVTK